MVQLLVIKTQRLAPECGYSAAISRRSDIDHLTAALDERKLDTGSGAARRQPSGQPQGRFGMGNDRHLPTR
jgi:hypothetical protein